MFRQHLCFVFELMSINLYELLKARDCRCSPSARTVSVQLRGAPSPWCTAKQLSRAVDEPCVQLCAPDNGLHADHEPGQGHPLRLEAREYSPEKVGARPTTMAVSGSVRWERRRWKEAEGQGGTHGWRRAAESTISVAVSRHTKTVRVLPARLYRSVCVRLCAVLTRVGALAQYGLAGDQGHRLWLGVPGAPHRVYLHPVALLSRPRSTRRHGVRSRAPLHPPTHTSTQGQQRRHTHRQTD
jgi:hypothetical protein